MVFGLNIVPTHGYYVDVEPVDGGFSNVELIDPTPDGGMKPRGTTSGRHIKTDGIPTKMQWLDRKGHPIPDFNRGLCCNVSKRAKDVIEAVEPGIHQFIPVEYVNGSGKHLEDRFFLIVGNRLDSIDREHTTLVLVRGMFWRAARDLEDRPELIPPGFDVSVEPKYVFNLSQIGDAHMWCDKHMSPSGVFISKAMADAFHSAGLTGLDLASNSFEAV